MRSIAITLCLALAACAGAPPPPDWQMDARGAIDTAVAAYLEGNARIDAAESARARSEIARTGRIDLLARAELMRCAARVASLAFEPCEEFEKLLPDADAAERAYADYLAGRIRPQDVALLPQQHRGVATGGEAALRAIDDPLSRLIAAAVLFRTNRAGPQTLQLAVDTASAQGWRRPLLAWLKVQLKLAEQAGARDEAERLRRRIDIVQAERALPAAGDGTAPRTLPSPPAGDGTAQRAPPSPPAGEGTGERGK